MVLIPMKFAFYAALMAMVAGAPVGGNHTGGVFVLPVKKELYLPKVSNRTALSRRADDALHAPLDFTGVRYFVDYSIAGQDQSAILDTGSSDTWTFSNQAWNGGFNPEKSGTYEWVSNDFEAAYGDGSNQVAGTWAKDTVNIGDASVALYDFAYLNQSMPNFPDHRGIFGIGPESAETKSYPSYFRRLKDQNSIESNSFSIFQSSNDGSEATLLIGGIDTAKYRSPLYTLPFDTVNFVYKNYYSIDFTFQGTKYTGGILDTGTPYVLLPEAVADNLASKYNAAWSDLQQCYVANAPPPSDLPGLDFELGGIKVTIPGNEVFVQYGGIYMFAISRNLQQLGQDFNILGDPLLRQLYLLFDNDKNEVAFAPVVVTEESSVTPVGSSIPDSTPAPDQSVKTNCVIC